jgi:hypothetical protein
MDGDDILLRLGSARRYPDLERLICAAAINPDLAAVLIADPASALDLPAYDFPLSPAERSLVVSIQHATDIYNFASRLHERIQHME